MFDGFKVASPKKTFGKPLIIGVTGGTASGKTSLCKRIGERFEGNIALVSLDSFYKGLS
jgi:uridine kinase